LGVKLKMIHIVALSRLTYFIMIRHYYKEFLLYYLNE